VILLDTHAWVWLVSDPDRLSSTSHDVIVGAETLAISAVSAWEVGMLIAKGRIEVDRDPRVWIRQAVAVEKLRVIDLDWTVAMTASGLEGLHGDPADRMIVATAVRQRCPLVTKDGKITDWSRRTRSISAIW
jgi:PIN domain nuclease of toxin-antitoxin system